MKPFDAHVCTECSTPHVDNCPNCFGYGLYKDRNSPIRSGDVDDVVIASLSDITFDSFVKKLEMPLQLTNKHIASSKYFDICPVCGGSPFNLDIFTLLGNPTKQKPIGILKA